MSLLPSAAGSCRCLAVLLLMGGIMLGAASAAAQDAPQEPAEPPAGSSTGNEELVAAPAKVDITPIARDEEIRSRLLNVLVATRWFDGPTVDVQQGVVFLGGYTETEELRRWAGDLARNTQDVVAVVNRIRVSAPSIFDFTPAITGVVVLWRDSIRALPFFIFGLLVLGFSVLAGMFMTRTSTRVLLKRIEPRLLRNVLAYGAGVLTFLCGVYIVLRVSGLTQLTLTVVGGTGLAGLILGIAFRDITENFLARIFLSIQKPFELGDLIEVAGVTGFVQQLNVRTTILMTLDGNVMQIPNAIIYKHNLRNFTTNSNRREEFDIGIGYDDSINDAQEIARSALADHPAVLNDPEPAVLVDSLGKATVNLRVYFWLNGREHSWLKVRYSVIRLVNLAFQKHGISMPDEAREVVFPQGVPVAMFDPGTSRPADAELPPRPAEKPLPGEDVSAVSTKAEAGLYSDTAVIEEQARQVQPLKEAENLLPGNSLKRPSGQSQ